MKAVLFFGIYDPGYARNRVLIEGLQSNGCRVIECRVDPRTTRGFSKYWKLYGAYRKIRFEPIDLVVVAFPGQTVMWLAKLLFKTPVVFDAFLSLYDSNVYDRKRYAPYSIRALCDWFWDWSSALLAQNILLDTNEHIAYFVRTFKTPRKKFLRVWIGADEHIFHPRTIEFPNMFTVHFHGTFIPLQGVSYILEAAHLLQNEPIRFRLVGSGQEFARMKQKADQLALSNVEFVGRVPIERVPEFIASAQVSLGIFGDSAKTQRVIPNKVFECMAMGRAVITADTPAVRELEEYGSVPLIRIPAANAPALAEAIRAAARDSQANARIGAEARAFFEKNLDAKQITADLLRRLASRFTASV